MHELSIASAVLDAVRREAGRHHGAHLRKVGVKVGELAGVDAGALTFCFESLVRGTELETVMLEVEPCPRRHRCAGCARAFTVVDYNLACPDCGSTQTDCISGDELELAYLEVEEP